MIEEARNLLRLMGIPTVQAPSEGEAQAAHMAATSASVWASASKDYDSLLFGASRLVRFITELQPATPSTDRDLLMSAFRELLLNAMEYGAGFDAEKVVEVTAARTARAIVYHFKDPGAGFDRGDLAHAAASVSPEAVMAAAAQRVERGLRPGGFGMLIARQVADEIVYNESGNEVILIKHIDR